MRRRGWRCPRKTRTQHLGCWEKMLFWSCFFHVFLTAPVCVLFASALAGAKAELKNMLKTISFYGVICVCAVCARSANVLQAERKSNTKPVKNHAKNTMPRKLKNTSKKHRFGSQNSSKNPPRRPPGAPWAPPARDLRAKSSPKALLESAWAQQNDLPRAQDDPKSFFKHFQAPDGRVRPVLA